MSETNCFQRMVRRLWRCVKLAWVELAVTLIFVAGAASIYVLGALAGASGWQRWGVGLAVAGALAAGLLIVIAAISGCVLVGIKVYDRIREIWRLSA
jgi:hypothetical protein